jgi:hypothetical protein
MTMLNLIQRTMFRVVSLIVSVVLLTYALTIPMQIDHYMRAILRGHYVLYYSIFMPVFVLTACCSVWLFRRLLSASWQAIVVLVLLGYLSSLVAFFFLPSQMPFRQIFSFRGINGIFFLSPLISLSWVYGLSVSFAIWIATRRNYFLHTTQ